MKSTARFSNFTAEGFDPAAAVRKRSRRKQLRERIRRIGNRQGETDMCSEVKICADWKFDSACIQSGSFRENNLVLRDMSGNGNHLRLNTERMPKGYTAASFMRFVQDGIGLQKEEE